MKRILSLVLILVLFCGCAAGTPAQGALSRYETTYLDLFDTITVIKGYAAGAAEFRAAAWEVHDALLEYHQLFDIYNDYEGLNNLKTVNDRAGGAAVPVDGKIIDLLLFCRDFCARTDGAVDVTLGAVLSLWHEARERGSGDPEHAAPPDRGALAEAARHTGFDLLEIDAAASAVRLTDPEARLDVGAVAKGYAVQQVCASAPPGLLLSVGGNVHATGPKPDGSSWAVGIQDPDGGTSDFLFTVNDSRGSVVTSGDYQRYFTADGVRYHHIIDPETLYPSVKWRAVSVLCPDSGLADGLSTALFLMDLETGQALLRSCGAEGMWAAADGSLYYTEGFQNAIRK